MSHGCLCGGDRSAERAERNSARGRGLPIAYPDPHAGLELGHLPSLVARGVHASGPGARRIGERRSVTPAPRVSPVSPVTSSLASSDGTTTTAPTSTDPGFKVGRTCSPAPLPGCEALASGPHVFHTMPAPVAAEEQLVDERAPSLRHLPRRRSASTRRCAPSVQPAGVQGNRQWAARIMSGMPNCETTSVRPIRSRRKGLARGRPRQLFWPPAPEVSAGQQVQKSSARTGRRRIFLIRRFRRRCGMMVK